MRIFWRANLKMVQVNTTAKLHPPYTMSRYKCKKTVAIIINFFQRHCDSIIKKLYL